MNPEDFIKLAKQMLKDTPVDNCPQVIIRTSINRAYLGTVSIAASILANRKGRTYPDDGTFYGEVEDDLTDEAPGLGDKLSELRKSRKEADYQLEFDMKRGKSVYSVKLAQSLVSDMRDKLM